MNNIKLLSDKDAKAYLDTLSSIDDPSDKESFTIRQNERIIKASDELLLERLESKDGSLRITDIVSAKDSAFKNNQKIKGLDVSDIQLIPANITINIQNNNA